MKEYQLYFIKNNKEYTKNIRAHNIDEAKKKLCDIYDGVDRIKGWQYIN